jgi:hypothetical protein
MALVRTLLGFREGQEHHPVSRSDPRLAEWRARWQELALLAAAGGTGAHTPEEARSVRPSVEGGSAVPAVPAPPLIDTAATPPARPPATPLRTADTEAGASRAPADAGRPVRVFVAMPGTTMGPSAPWRSIPEIRRWLLVPVAERIGRLLGRDTELVIEREKTSAGTIHRSMFQEALGADVCLADLTGANANVYLELGVHWALHDGVTLLICQEESPVLFNAAFSRVIPYGATPDALEEAISRPSVDLPAPEVPKMASRSPGRTTRSTPCRIDGVPPRIRVPNPRTSIRLPPTRTVPDRLVAAPAAPKGASFAASSGFGAAEGTAPGSSAGADSAVGGFTAPGGSGGAGSAVAGVGAARPSTRAKRAVLLWRDSTHTITVPTGPMSWRRYTAAATTAPRPTAPRSYMAAARLDGVDDRTEQPRTDQTRGGGQGVEHQQRGEQLFVGGHFACGGTAYAGAVRDREGRRHRAVPSSGGGVGRSPEVGAAEDGAGAGAGAGAGSGAGPRGTESRPPGACDAEVRTAGANAADSDAASAPSSATGGTCRGRGSSSPCASRVIRAR